MPRDIPKSSQPKCQAVTKAGKPCSFQAAAGRPFCFVHDPDREAERQAARSRGGQGRQGRAKRARAYTIGTLQALVESMSEVFCEVKAGTMTWRQGSALASIGNVILSTLKAPREKGAVEVASAEDAITRIRALYGLPPKPESEQQEPESTIATTGDDRLPC